jgi:hypothetical protein
VLDLVQFLKGSGRNVTTDNFFTSVNLARELRNRQMTLVGTMRSARREVPKALVHQRGRSLYSSIFACNLTDGVELISYKAKPSKTVLLLSSQHKDVTVTEEPSKKPRVILYYNSTKGGVDAIDERVGTYTVKFSTRRWHVVVFCNILDLSLYNASFCIQ